MYNLIIRTLTGALFVLVLLASLWAGGYAFLLFFGIIVFIGTFEIVFLIAKRQKAVFTAFCAFIALLIFLLSNNDKLACCSFISSKCPNDIYILLFFIPIVGLFSRGASMVKLIAAGISGALILPISFTALTNIFVSFNGYILTLAFFCIIWAYDTFAYLVGSVVGRRRICASISQKKSWEGAIAGLIFAIVCSAIFSYYTDILTLWQWMVYGIIICVFGTIGDFCESLLKRYANAKDSGKIFPGHGGILDRFDSTIFASPFVLLYLHIVKQVLL